MAAYDPEPWHDLFVAAAGASAALAGLIFVAVSINIERILALDGVADRALQALMQLLLVVVVALFALAPGQAAATLGVELVVLGLLVGAFSFRLVQHTHLVNDEGLLVRRLVIAAGFVPFTVAGLSLIAGSGGGLYWVLAGIVLATIGSVANAWVLLVEILR